MQEIKTFEDRKNELVKLGKEKGLITYEQLAGALKGLDLDSDSLDELYNAFSENNIAVVSEEDQNGENGGMKEELILDDDILTKDLNINDVKLYAVKNILEAIKLFSNQ